MNGNCLMRSTIKIICLSCLLSMTQIAANAQETTANISVTQQDAIFSVNASIVLPVTSCEAFSLLTDYDSLPNYVPGILETHYERTATNVVKVWQTGEVGVLFFHIKMETLLEMEEIPNQQILFRQIDGDLESYGGEWNFMEVPEGTRVVYMSALTLKHYIPAFMATSILENEISQRFDAIFKEAIARKGKTPSSCMAEK